MDAQLGLQRVADGAGADEADQAAGEDRCLRPGGQADGQPPGGDVIDRSCPGRRRRRCRRRSAARTAPDPGAGSPRLLVPGRISAGAAGRGLGIEPLRAVTGPSCRARPGGGAGLPSGLGRGSSSRCAQEAMPRNCCRWLAGDQAPPADLDVGQVAAAHLVIAAGRGTEPVRRAASSAEQASRPLVRVLACTASGAGGDVVIGRRRT